MAELNVGSLNMTIEVDGRAAIFELDRVKEAAEGSSTEAAKAYEETSRAAEDAFRKAGDAAEKMVDDVGGALERVEKFGTSMTTWATAPLTALYAAMTSSASDLTETVGKTETVFGDASDSVMSWSEAAVEGMGLAQGTALDMASTFGDLGTAMGFDAQSAAEMSMTLTQLSADLASFKNIGADRAAQALMGVYTGETEALKGLGVVMTQANLQAFALAQGITTQVSAMSQAEQVQLRYAYVMQQTANAQGDFVRTGGNLANQSRALTQTLKQAGTAFGELLTPAVTSVVSTLREAALWLAQLDEGTKMTLLSIGGAVAAIGPLTLAISKTVKAVMALKTAMAAASFGPIALAVTAMTAAIGVGLHGALTKANEEIDTTSDEYQRMRQIVAGGVEADVTVDMSAVDEIDGTTVATVNIDGDAQAALTKAGAIVDELKKPEYKGMLTIDGDPAKAEAALNALDAAVQAMTSGTGSLSDLQDAIDACEELVISPELSDEQRAEVQAKLDALKAELAKLEGATITFDADGQAALDKAKGIVDELKKPEYEGMLTIDGDPQKAQDALDALDEAVRAMASGTGSLADLEAAIDACEALVVSPEMDEEQRAELQLKLDALKLEIASLKDAEITFKVGEAADSDKKAWDDFHAKVTALDWTEKSFTATGKFDISEGTTEAIEEYALALAEAATATSDYDAAVESLNALLDKQMRAQMDEINAQVVEEARKLVAMSNEGLIDEAEFDRQMEIIVNGAKAARAELEAQAEAQKELNEQFADGDLLNDPGALGDMMRTTYSDETLGETDFQGALVRLENARAAGEDLTQLHNEGKVVLNELAQQTVANYEAMTAAQQKYDEAMANTNKAEQSALETNQPIVENAEVLKEAIEEYLVALDMYNGDAGSAIDEAASVMSDSTEEYEQLKQQLTELLTNPDTGEFVGEDVSGAYETVENVLTTAQTNIETATTEAQAAREAALAEYQETMSTLASDFTTQEADMILALVNQTGVAIDEADAEMIGAVTGMITQLSATLSTGNADVAAGVSELIAGVKGEAETAEAEGKAVGAAITAGITTGLQDGTGALYVAVDKIVKSAIRQAKTSAGIASPSRVMRDEVGRMLVEGVTVGVERETPNAVQAIQRSMDGIVSGAAAVVNRGSYTVPAAESASAGVDYERMGAAVADAVSGLNMSFNVDGRTLARAQRENTARQQALRTHEVNMGRGRVE